MSRFTCPTCDAVMLSLRHDWLWRCTGCGFLASTLDAYSVERDVDSVIDESRRVQALKSLRQRNCSLLLAMLRATEGGLSGRLLDVGCAHGWFLAAAAQAGFSTAGIEPDATMHAMAAQRCSEVHRGFFPEDLPDESLFDVIVFNDVLEHLPRVNDVVAACRRHIRPGGRLLVNLPSSRGAVYRIAERLDSFGVHSPFDRLWQRRFPSPHISYFHPDCLTLLVGRHGFTEAGRRRIPSLQLQGLWSRLRYDKTMSPAASAGAYAMTAPFVMVSALLPPDTVAQVFRRADG